MTRRDVIIVASVSCIYNLGSPEDYAQHLLYLEKGQEIDRDKALLNLVDIHYERNDMDFKRGTFRVRGETIEIYPAYRQDALRVVFFGDEIEKIYQINPITGDIIATLERIAIYPAKHFVVPQPRIDDSIKEIMQEMQARVKDLQQKGKLVEAQRLESRTKFDMEMLKEMGFCNGIENYSRALSGRPPGSRPFCLIDYFPKSLTMSL
jgi:excinuclease ABC subunit B